MGNSYKTKKSWKVLNSQDSHELEVRFQMWWLQKKKLGRLEKSLFLENVPELLISITSCAKMLHHRHMHMYTIQPPPPPCPSESPTTPAIHLDDRSHPLPSVSWSVRACPAHAGSLSVPGSRQLTSHELLSVCWAASTTLLYQGILPVGSWVLSVNELL